MQHTQNSEHYGHARERLECKDSIFHTKGGTVHEFMVKLYDTLTGHDRAGTKSTCRLT